MVLHLPNMVIPLITYLDSPLLQAISKKNDPWSFFTILRPPWTTLYFSQDLASIAGVILAMDTLTNMLDLETKMPYHPSILTAIMFARKKINHYYLLTDKAVSYQVAMGMSPIFYYVARY